MKWILSIILFYSPVAFSQYYPRGTTMNNNYWPNIEEPIMWFIALDGMYDFQNEKRSGSDVSTQTTHANFNLFYGGRNFRAGANVIHDFNLVTKDLSMGLGMAFGRPLFFEFGVGYLSRVRDSTSTEGWSYHGKIGYNFPWLTDVKYRTRFRIALVYNQKTLNDNGDPRVTHFYPIIGIEFET